ncbi:MAG: hypothetical protein AAB890_01710, partial [Patescibacteria group bacterium]
MEYYTPEEMKTKTNAIKKGFAAQASVRPLPLKGKCVDIFCRSLKNKDSKILDFGTGSGGFLKELSSIG